MSQAYVVNGVVVSDDGNLVRYHTRCPRCGYVDIMSTQSCCIAEGVIRNVGSVPCVKCSTNSADGSTYYFPIQVNRGK